MPRYRYRKVALGGTFSLLHAGHRHFIRQALNMGENVVIGVTSDEFAQKMGKRHPVEPYEVRALRVLRYCLRKMKRGQRVTVLPLDDVAGPALYDTTIEAIIATEETFLNALHIALSRENAPMDVVVIEPLLDEKGVPFSSTRLWQAMKH